MSTIYLDNAATTKVREEVVSVISSIIKKEYGNPSSTHSYGRSSKSLIESALSLIHILTLPTNHDV